MPSLYGLSMENVNVADQKVSRLRALIVNSAGKGVVALPIDEAIGYLQCIERLAAIERHLYNLTSNGYAHE